MPEISLLEVVWPAQLIQPARPPKIVYLDLNHWIGLAKAATRHQDAGPYAELLSNCRAAQASGDAVFPLSETHYFEMSRIKDPRQRYQVAAVMEELSEFLTVLGLSPIRRLELATTLDVFLSPFDPIYQEVPLLGAGFSHAFGRRGEFRVRDSITGADLTAIMRERIGVDLHDSIMADVDLQLNRSILRGPTDAEVAGLRSCGWNPEAIHAYADQRAQQEREQAARLDQHPRWRRGRLRDVVSAREVIIELLPMVEEIAAARGMLLAEVLRDDRDLFRLIFGSMPSLDVAIGLKTSMHRDANRRWTTNDISDIDALANVVPYCDVVLTEKSAHTLLTACRLDTKMKTTVLRRPSDLSELL